MWLGELSKIGIPSIYFDAFANDYHEDAFITLAGEIIARSATLEPRNAKTLKTFKGKAIRVAKVLGRASLRFGVRAASAGLIKERGPRSIRAVQNLTYRTGRGSQQVTTSRETR